MRYAGVLEGMRGCALTWIWPVEKSEKLTVEH